jgi:hypothetical protein
LGLHAFVALEVQTRSGLAGPFIIYLLTIPAQASLMPVGQALVLKQAHHRTCWSAPARLSRIDE